MENLSEYLLVLQLFYYLRVLGGSTAKLKGAFFNKMSEIRSNDPTITKARKSATDNYYNNENPGTNIDSVKAFINQKIGSLQNKPSANNNLLLSKFVNALKFLNDNYTKDGAKKDTIVKNDNSKPKPPADEVKPAAPAPATLVPAVKPAPSAKPSKPQYKTREDVIQELMSQGKITDPSQAVALSSPVTVNGRTFQALISPLGTLPGPGGVRVPIINDQQANTYAMSILKEYNKLAGVGYQPLNDIGKKNLDPKNVEPLKKLLTRIDLAVNNKTSHEQTADGEPILSQMREPKLSADTENLYNILKRLSGQTLGSIAQPDKAKSLVQPANDSSSGLDTQVKKNDVIFPPVTTKNSVTPADIPFAGINTTRKPQISDSIPEIEVSIPPIRQRVPKFNTDIIKDDTLDNVTPPDQVIDSSQLVFVDENKQRIPNTDNPNGFFEHILDFVENSDYYNVSNKMPEADFIKRVSECKTPQDKNNKNKCWTEFPEFMLEKLSRILGTYRTPDNKIYKTIKEFIPIGIPLNIQMIMNLIEANDPRYSNLSESFIGVK
jgi:hypothetical protein